MEYPGIQPARQHAGGRPAHRSKARDRGSKTDVQFNSCVWIDPANGDIYSVENDIGDSIVVFSHDAEGDLAPKRHLKITHRGYAMTVECQAEGDHSGSEGWCGEYQLIPGLWPKGLDYRRRLRRIDLRLERHGQRRHCPSLEDSGSKNHGLRRFGNCPGS